MVPWDPLLSAPSILTDLTPEAAFARQITSWNSIAALAWLYWDVCLTTVKEIEVVWPVRRSFIKFLYFFIRYMSVCLLGSNLVVGTLEAFQYHFTQHDCFIWQVYQVLVLYFLTLAVEYVLVLRVYALYSRHRLLTIVLPVLFLTEAITMLVSLIIFLPQLKYDLVCASVHVPPTTYLYGASTCAFQAVLFLLTATKFFKALRAGWNTTPVITLLMRDGSWSFFLLMSIMTGYGLVLVRAEGRWSSLLYNWLIGVFSFIGYRNLLNIFELSQRVNATEASTTITEAHHFSTYMNLTHGIYGAGDEFNYEMSTLPRS